MTDQTEQRLRAISRELPWVLDSIEVLGLSVRAYNALWHRAGIRFLGQLVETTDLRLLKVPNFGRKSLKEVRMCLGDLGLCLGLKLPDVTADSGVSGDREADSGPCPDAPCPEGLSPSVHARPLPTIVPAPASLREELLMARILPGRHWQDLLSLSQWTWNALSLHRKYGTMEELVEAVRGGGLSADALGTRHLAELLEELARRGIGEAPPGPRSGYELPKDLHVLCELAICRMQPRCQPLVRGCFLEGRTLQQVADEDFCSSERARQLIAKALSRIRGELRQALDRCVAPVADALPEDGSPLSGSVLKDLVGEPDPRVVRLAMALARHADTVIRNQGLAWKRPKAAGASRLAR